MPAIESPHALHGPGTPDSVRPGFSERFWTSFQRHELLLMTLSILLAGGAPIVLIGLTDLIGFKAPTTVGEAVTAVSTALALVAVIAIAFVPTS